MTRDHFVYRLYDDSGEVIYVGCTRRPRRRWLEHTKQSPEMVAETAHRYMSGPYDGETARRIEREQLLALRPKYDSSITPRKSTNSVGVNGAKMRELRIRLGLPIAELAADLGVNRSYVTKIELGISKRVSPQLYRRLLSRLGLEDYRSLLIAQAVS